MREALNLPERGAVSLVGAGGKSSLMRCLGLEYAKAGCRVVETTTTHLSRAQGRALGDPIAEVSALAEAFARGNPICVAQEKGDGVHLCAPSDTLLRAAFEQSDVLLVEADGAHRYPVKAPAAHEPCLFEPTDAVVAVAGLSALGQPMEAACHRWELACALLGVASGTTLTPPLLAKLLTSEQGQRKNVGNPARFRILLNQADDVRTRTLARETADEIQKNLPGCRVVIAALRDENAVKEVRNA